MSKRPTPGPVDLFDAIKLIDILADLGWDDQRIVEACETIVDLDQAIDKTLKVKTGLRLV